MGFETILAPAAIMGLMAGFWDKIKSLIGKILNIFFITADFEPGLGSTVEAYLWHNYNKINFSKKYSQIWSYSISEKKELNIPTEELSRTTDTLFYNKYAFLLFSPKQQEKNNNDKNETALEASGRFTLTSIRGLINFNQLVLNATKKNIELTNKSKEIDNKNNICNYFYIRKHIGYKLTEKNSTAGFISGNDKKQEPHWLRLNFSTLTPLYDKNDLFPFDPNVKPIINSLFYPQEIYVFIERIKKWIKSEEWYVRKGISWRYGSLLFGPAGTGKSSLVKGIGEMFGLPIHIFDLGSMDNQDFITAWDEHVVHSTPCIVLFEDIDVAFEGRKSINTKMTFDCFINCISGVDNPDGVLIFGTANNINKLDPALIRPGRFDTIIELKSMTFENRLIYAKKILSDCPKLIEKTVTESEGFTPAEFMEKCVEIALTNSLHLEKISV